MAVTGCGGGGSTTLPGLSTASAAASSSSPITSSARQTTARRGTKSVTAQQSLCVAGSQYTTTEDDEFSQDTSLNYTSNQIGATPAPNGAMWSSQAFGFSNNGTRNNVGTDDAYYTDPSRGFGGYNPFSIANGALNITAAPVPAAYASASQLDGAHWLSGVLEGPAQTYGYVEVSAKEPNAQGYWPAPLWLLGMAGNDGKGNGYEELDVNELFGNSLGKSVIQQTQIFNLSGTPPANHVRTTVSPDPSTSYHTYGVLWTPATVQYFIDRQPTSPAYPNAANGPANPIIILQVFAANTWAPAPASATPATMSLQYFRWYQTTNASCSPSVIGSPAPSPAPSATPVPSPTPTVAASPTPTVAASPTPTPVASSTPVIVAHPSPTPTVAPTTIPVAPVPLPSPIAIKPTTPVVEQNTGVVSYPANAAMTATFTRAPKVGDTLIAFINTSSPLTAPKGWDVKDAPSRAGFFIYSGVVGQNGLAAATSYDFGSNSGMLQVLDISGGSTTEAVASGSDPVEWQAQFPRSLTIPSANGLLLAAWGGYSYGATGFDAINEQLPAGQKAMKLTEKLNDAVDGGGAFSLRIDRITTEPHSAAQPFTMIGTLTVSSDWIFNGDLVWIAPK